MGYLYALATPSMPVIVKNRRDDPRRRGAAGRGQLGGHVAATRAVRAAVLRGGTPLSWSRTAHAAMCARRINPRRGFSTQRADEVSVPFGMLVPTNTAPPGAVLGTVPVRPVRRTSTSCTQLALVTCWHAPRKS